MRERRGEDRNWAYRIAVGIGLRGLCFPGVSEWRSRTNLAEVFCHPGSSGQGLRGILRRALFDTPSPNAADGPIIDDRWLPSHFRGFRQAAAVELRDRHEDGDENKPVLPIHYRSELIACLATSIGLMIARKADRLA